MTLGQPDAHYGSSPARREHDPFVSLGMAAAVTERIRVGTAICLVVERDPILVGGNGATVLDRVLAFGDAWFPNRIGNDDDFMIGQIEELQRRGAEAGRGAIPVTLQIPPREPERVERYERAERMRVLAGA